MDIWPVYALLWDCFIVNFSIPVFTSVELQFGSNSDIINFTKMTNIKGSNKKNKISVEVSSPSGFYKQPFFSLKDLFEEPADDLKLLKKHLQYWHKHLKQKNDPQIETNGEDFKDSKNLPGGTGALTQIEKKSEDSKSKAKEKKGFDRSSKNKEAGVSKGMAGVGNICLKSESPVGAGLGGSSSLCVSLAKAFSSLCEQVPAKNDLLMLCRDLETSLLHAPAGFQDYIPALESAPDFLYIIECTPSGPKWKRKNIPLPFFKDHALLIDTGKSHHSGNSNWVVLKRIIEKDQKILNGLYQLRDNALETVEICERENWSDLFVSLAKEQKLRKEYFPRWLTPSISSFIDMIMGEGAQSVKLCGAGGGGCLMVLTQNKAKKKHLESVCEKNRIPIIMKW